MTSDIVMYLLRIPEVGVSLLGLLCLDDGGLAGDLLLLGAGLGEASRLTIKLPW